MTAEHIIEPNADPPFEPRPKLDDLRDAHAHIIAAVHRLREFADDATLDDETRIEARETADELSEQAGDVADMLAKLAPEAESR